jgi:hypothetical protein
VLVLGVVVGLVLIMGYFKIYSFNISSKHSSNKVLNLTSINVTSSTGVTYSHNSTQIVRPIQVNIMNLLGGQSNFYVPHIYVGGWISTINTYYLTNQWPVLCNINIANTMTPILKFVPSGAQDSGSVMFWNYTYVSGESVTIRMVGTFTVSTWLPADGFVFYFFVLPGDGWVISSGANYSKTLGLSFGWPYSGVSAGGALIIPKAGNGTYLIIQWDPWYAGSGYSGEFNVFVVNVSDGRITNGSAFGPVGSGVFVPRPGDLLVFVVSYNASANSVVAVVRDLSTGWVSSLDFGLSGYFEPPESGLYLFGVGAATGADHANWGVLYVSQSLLRG